MKRIGVDVGGTFTDLVLVDEDTGTITVDKVASTPDDPARGVVEGIRAALRAKAGVPLAEIDNLLHGTTVATNIALTHTGAEVGMITTEGFRDILHIARHKKPFNFSLQQELPWQSRPLVKRRHRLTVAERVTVPHGDVLVELDEDEVRERVRAAARRGRRGRRRLPAALATSTPRTSSGCGRSCWRSSPTPSSPSRTRCCRCTASSSASRPSRSTPTSAPRSRATSARFADAMQEEGFRHGVQLMQSSGGMATIESAAAAPGQPAHVRPGGRACSAASGRAALAGHDNVVTLDIGGTSADIGVAAGGQLRMRHLLDTKVGDYQAMVPMVDIDTIGAGGGSIAYVDEGGVFRVGPQSAGADPGSGLLRPRRHGADLDRRAAPARAAAARPRPARAATCASTSTSPARR